MSDRSDEDKKAKSILEKLLGETYEKIDEAHREAEAPSDANKEAPSAETLKMADRLDWIIRVALAHAAGDMPWRANPPTKQDEQWCEEVIIAVRDKRARPSHPDPDIEQMLLNGLPT